MALSYGILWNIFQDHTEESLKIELKEQFFFFAGGALETKSLKEGNRFVFWPPSLFLSLQQNGKWTLLSGYLPRHNFFFFKSYKCAFPLTVQPYR